MASIRRTKTILIFPDGRSFRLRANTGDYIGMEHHLSEDIDGPDAAMSSICDPTSLWNVKINDQLVASDVTIAHRAPKNARFMGISVYVLRKP